MWRLCGTEAEPRVVNSNNGKIWEVYPNQVKDFNTDYWHYRGYKGEPLVTQYGPEGPSLDDVHIDITNKCNMACKHCYANCGPTSREEMNLEDFELLCKNAAACGAARIAISGGEAILHPKYHEIPNIVKEHGLVLTAIFSNGKSGIGSLISRPASEHASGCYVRFVPEWTQLIFSHNPSLGQDVERVTKELMNCSPCNNMVTISTITASGNDIWDIYNKMKEVAEYRATQCNARFRWRVGAVRPIGRGEKLDVDLVGIKAVYHRIFDDYMMNWKIWQKCKFDLQIGFAFRSDFLTRPIDAYQDDDTCCRYKQNSICVKWNGNVTPCTMDQTSYGHMSDLRDAWVAVNKGGHRVVQSKSIAACKDCRLRKYCNGGCRLCAKDGECDPISKMTYEFFEEILPRVEGARL